MPVFERPLMWVLALATLISGVALLMMVLQRKQEARQQREAELAKRRPPPPRKRVEEAPLIAHPSANMEDLSKICPACGSRYGAEYRVCARDDVELSALN